MAYSFVQYVATGGSQYAIPFPYLKAEHITVMVDGVNVTNWSINSDGGSITFSYPYPTAGLSTVRITRNSSRALRLTAYQDAQVLTKAQMDYDALQIFYVAQEAYDAVAEAASGGDMRRSYNLADVYDVNAARENIGAIAKYGTDTISARLYYVNTPYSPSELCTKGYVDSLVGGFGSGVDSFNTRVGAVTLLSSDVTGALGYTPVNKAGDTMTGHLTLSGAPTSSLHAATKAYVDAAIPGSTLLTTDNIWTGKNWFAKLDAVDNPTVQVASINDGPIVAGDSYPGSTQYITLDVIKTVDQSVQTGSIRAAQEVRMRVKGNTVVDAISHAVTAYMDFRGTRTGSVTNAGGAVTGSTENRGTNAYTWGTFGEGTHNEVSGTTGHTYGVLGSGIRKTNNGYQAAIAARVYGASGYLPQDAGVTVVPFGDSTLAKAIAAFQAGSATHGTLVCDYGLDLRYASCTNAAVAIPAGKKFQWGVSGVSPVTERYDPAAGLMFTEVAGSARMALNINSGSFPPATIFHWDGIAPGGVTSYYTNMIGNGALLNPVWSIRNGGRMVGPTGVPTSCQGWIPILIDGVARLIPFY